MWAAARYAAAAVLMSLLLGVAVSLSSLSFSWPGTASAYANTPANFLDNVSQGVGNLREECIAGLLDVYHIYVTTNGLIISTVTFSKQFYAFGCAQLEPATTTTSTITTGTTTTQTTTVTETSTTTETSTATVTVATTATTTETTVVTTSTTATITTVSTTTQIAITASTMTTTTTQIQDGVPATACVLKEPWLLAFAVFAAGVLAVASLSGSIVFALISGSTIYVLAHVFLSGCGLEPSLLLGLALYVLVFVVVREAILRYRMRKDEETIVFY